MDKVCFERLKRLVAAADMPLCHIQSGVDGIDALTVIAGRIKGSPDESRFAREVMRLHLEIRKMLRFVAAARAAVSMIADELHVPPPGANLEWLEDLSIATEELANGVPCVCGSCPSRESPWPYSSSAAAKRAGDGS